MARSVRVGVVDVHKGLRLFQPLKRDFEFEVVNVNDLTSQENTENANTFSVEKSGIGVKRLVLE